MQHFPGFGIPTQMAQFLELPVDLQWEIGKHLSWDDLTAVIWVEEFHPMIRALGRRHVLELAKANDPGTVGRWGKIPGIAHWSSYHDPESGPVILDDCDSAEFNCICIRLGWHLISSTD